MQILNDYLTPEEYPHSAELIVELEIHRVASNPTTVDTNTYYQMTLRGKCTSANFSLDSTSDMRTSGSFELILDDTNQDFIDNSSTFLWYNKIIKVTKYYKYNNDLGFYDTYNWGDRTSLVKYTINGVKSDPSRCVVGWFVPNQASYSFNASEKKLSLSCTDVMAYFNSEMGGCLSEWATKKIDYRIFNNDNYLKSTAKDESGYQSTITTSNLTRQAIVDRTSGIAFTGTINQVDVSSQFNNIFNEGISDKNKENFSTLWQEEYDIYKQDKTNLTLADYNFVVEEKENLGSAYNALMEFTQDYLHSTPVFNIFINLENIASPLPYDLEFSGDSTIYDVYKKVIDLYPRQQMFIDTNKVLNLIQRPTTYTNVVVLGREFSNLVISESRNVNFSNIKNTAVVYGKDNTCVGMYARKMFRQKCNYCGTYKENITSNSCYTCGRNDYTIQRYDDALAIENIGEKLIVDYDDNCMTDLECDNKARHLVDEYCRLGETITVTLIDRGFSFNSFVDNGVGGLIEYKSKVTGETNVYNLVKWSNSITNDESTITLELEPFRSIYEDYGILKTPTYTYSIDENGLMTMNINNDTHSKISLFKIYISTADEGVVFYINDFSYVTCSFVGETCTEIDEITGTKQFKYQFKENGKYYVYVIAYNPSIAPSNQSEVSEITIDIFTNKLKSYNGDYIKTEDDSYLLYS